MAVSAKYGKVNIPKIGSEEPVFILRAQDKLADSLDKEVQAFRKWQGAKKLPD